MFPPPSPSEHWHDSGVGSTADIRIAGPEDVNDIVALNAALFREDAGQRDPFMDQGWPTREGHAYFASMVADPRCRCFLAVDGDTVVGYLAGRIGEPRRTRPVPVAVLESFYVRAAFRSRRVGERLARAFLRWAHDQGVEQAEVEAFVANDGAIRFYRRIGFEPKRMTLEMAVEADPT
jgi:ribosomal protein S18 acetylase RimI-like enzyme